MTFDDGPHPVLTPRLLDMLKARGDPINAYYEFRAPRRPHDRVRLLAVCA
jgi:hypothetical protein